jgi:predicted HTH transcriptional regulator
LQRIYDLCKKSDAKVSFKTLKSGFLTIFYRKDDYNEKDLEKVEKEILKPEKDLLKPKKDLLKPEKDLENPEKDLLNKIETNYKLNNSQIKILKEIFKNSKITQKELSEIVGINEKNIRNNMNKLKELKIIERIGSKKYGKWKIN